MWTLEELDMIKCGICMYENVIIKPTILYNMLIKNHKNIIKQDRLFLLNGFFYQKNFF
jgi:hypothetical protein